MPQVGPELEEPKRTFQAYQKTRFLAAMIFALVLCVICAMVGMYLAGRAAFQKVPDEPAPVISGRVLEERLQSVQKLVSTEYYYTQMGSFEEQRDFYGWTIPFTTKRFIVSYDGVIKAGVDLSQARVEVSEGRVTVTLPEAAVISHEIPEDSIKVMDESNNVLNPIRIEDYTGFTQEQKQAMEEQAIGNGLLEVAKEKAVDAVTTFLQFIPEVEGYALTVS